MAILAYPLIRWFCERWPGKPWPYLPVAAFVVYFAWPFWGGNFAGQLVPLAGPNPVPAVVDPLERDFVVPFGPVGDERSPMPGGSNISATQVLSPAFVTETHTGPYMAALLDRITSREPTSNDILEYFRMGRVANVVVQTSLVSQFARYVNSYRDQWLFDTFQPPSMIEHLARSVVPQTIEPGLTIFPTDGGDPIAGADRVVALDGSLADVAAVSHATTDGIYLQQELLSDDSLRNDAGAYVRAALQPDLAIGPDDAKNGDEMDAGQFVGVKSADFHREWVSLIPSANWWLTPRMLGASSPAVTDAADVEFTVPVPPGPRHLYVQYFASSSGGRIVVRCGGTDHVLNTRIDSLGFFDWLDCGEIGESADHALTITNIDGLNAVGRILMLDAPAARHAAWRYSQLTKLPTATVLADVTLPGRQPFNVPASRQPLLLTASAAGKDVRFSASAALIDDGSSCVIRLREIHLADFRVMIDGSPPPPLNVSTDTPPFPCAAGDLVYLGATQVQTVPTRVLFDGENPLLQVFTPNMESLLASQTLSLQQIPLSDRMPREGYHTLDFVEAWEPLAPRGWSVPMPTTADDATSNQGASPAPDNPFARGSVSVHGFQSEVRLDTADAPAELRAELPLRSGNIYRVEGTYVSPVGEARFRFWDPARAQSFGGLLLSKTSSRRPFSFSVAVSKGVQRLELLIDAIPAATGDASRSASLTASVGVSATESAPIQLRNWSDVGDAASGAPGIFSGTRTVLREGYQTVVSMSVASHIGSINTPFGSLQAGDSYEIAGTYVCPEGSLRVVVWDPAAGQAIAETTLDSTEVTRSYTLRFVPMNDVDSTLLYVYAQPATLGENEAASATLTLRARVSNFASANFLIAPQGFDVPHADPLQSHERGADDLAVKADRRRIVELTETYDPLWTIDDSRSHLESAEGFNVWLTSQRSRPFSVYFKTRLPYRLGLALGCLWLLALLGTAIALRYRGSRRPSTNSGSRGIVGIPI
ncbi:MAG TPA: hypothetical protein VME66_06950 [Candidatus Acidoferrales bacterium]|nr:hypothetical protein [Candidatus Acidoferrales bacterium]